jgi:hypothetical protein
MIVNAATLLCCLSATAQTLTLTQVEESIIAVGDAVQQSYFDPALGRQVAQSLREGLSEGRFPNLTTAQDLADTMNQELLFLTHDKDVLVSVIVRDQQPRIVTPNISKPKTTSRSVRTYRLNQWLQIAVPAKR